MAKEFEQWNKRWSAAEIREYRQGHPLFEYDHIQRTHWLHRDSIEVHTYEKIREAVYESNTAPFWQKFRVALKGLSTSQKLCALELLWKMNPHGVYNKIRIDNYIGALVRGGQLSKDYEVLK